MELDTQARMLHDSFKIRQRQRVKKMDRKCKQYELGIDDDAGQLDWDSWICTGRKCCGKETGCGTAVILSCLTWAQSSAVEASRALVRRQLCSESQKGLRMRLDTHWYMLHASQYEALTFAIFHRITGVLAQAKRCRKATYLLNLRPIFTLVVGHGRE